MKRREMVSIIGTGKVGTAVAKVLLESGCEITSLYDADSKALQKAAPIIGVLPAKDLREAVESAEVVIITTPDGEIEEVSRRISEECAHENLASKKFVHMSGALPLGVLSAVRNLGAEIFCVHPIQTFADWESAVRSLPGSTFGVTCDEEGWEWAKGFVSRLGGRAERLSDEDKVKYHLACVFACNFPVILFHMAECLFEEVGFSVADRKSLYMPMVRTTIDNVERLGPAAALTGPLRRGDVETVKVHLRELESYSEEVLATYHSISLGGLKMLEREGKLDKDLIERMRLELGG